MKIGTIIFEDLREDIKKCAGIDNGFGQAIGYGLLAISVALVHAANVLQEYQPIINKFGERK